MGFKYSINGNQIVSDNQLSDTELDEVASQMSKKSPSVALAEPPKPKPEGIIEGTLKPIARGLVETGAGSLDALEGLNQMLGLVKSGKTGIMGERARLAREQLDTGILKRGEISGGIPGRVAESLTGLAGTIGQFEIAGAGSPIMGATTLGVLQGGPSIQDKIKAVAMNNLAIGGFKAISTLPLVPRILLGASAFGVPTMAQNDDPTQTTADFITGAIVGGVSKSSVERQAPVKEQTKPPIIIKDAETAKSLLTKSPTEVIQSVSATLGSKLKPVLAKAMSMFSSGSEGYARDLLDHPEYADTKFVRGLEKIANAQYQKVVTPLVKDTKNRVVLDDGLKKSVQDMNLFVESQRTPGPQEQMFKQIAEQTGGKIPREFQEAGAPKGVPFGKEPTASLTGLKDAEKVKIREWSDKITENKDMSFNEAHAMIREIDSQGQMQKRYKQLTEFEKGQNPPPSPEFVRLGSVIRSNLSNALKSQYPEAGKTIDQTAHMINARNVNRAFSKINPHLFNRLMVTVGARALGLPLPPGAEFAVLAATSPKAQAMAVRTATGIGEAIKAAVDPNIKFKGQSQISDRIKREAVRFSNERGSVGVEGKTPTGEGKSK